MNLEELRHAADVIESQVVGAGMATPLAAWLRLTADRGEYDEILFGAAHPAIALAQSVLATHTEGKAEVIR